MTDTPRTDAAIKRDASDYILILERELSQARADLAAAKGQVDALGRKVKEMSIHASNSHRAHMALDAARKSLGDAIAAFEDTEGRESQYMTGVAARVDLARWAAIRDGKE